MLGLAQEKEIYLANFALLEERFGKKRWAWPHPLRQRAMARFAELGYPSTENEDWRFTSLAPLSRVAFRAAAAPEAGQESVAGKLVEWFTLGDGKASQLVFINGYFSQKLSSLRRLPSGVRAGSLAEALEKDSSLLERHLARYLDYRENAFAALNTAFIADGAFLHLPKDTVLEEPIHLLFLSIPGVEATVSHPRNLILAGAGSQAKIVEGYAGLEDGPYFTNGVTELVAGENAIIDHYKLQRESLEAFHIGILQIQQERNAHVSTHSIALGGALVRNEVRTVLDGEGGEATLNGFYLLKGTQQVDNHTTIDHARPHCTSRELYKGILDDSSRAVFNGRIIVRPDAQKTDAKQTNKNLLLSEEALVNTNPQLAIYANDVKCTHGATIGQLDADAVFYLRSRGIDRETARQLLIYAFASDILGRIKIEGIRLELEKTLLARLPQGQRLLDANPRMD